MSKSKAKMPKITLHNLDVEEILSSYYGSNEKDDGIVETKIKFDNECTNINDLLHERGSMSKRTVTFFDSRKSKIKLWGNMIDIAQNGALPLYTTKPCWWCRSTFKTLVLGCPIFYYNSEDPAKKSLVLEHFQEGNLPTDCGTDFFGTEGIFCSFTCIKSYILDEISRTKMSRYQKALTLLTLLRLKLTGELAVTPTADSWKVLIDWGGHLTPSEFRASTGLLEYKNTVNIRRPYMYSTSAYIQERRVCV